MLTWREKQTCILFACASHTTKESSVSMLTWREEQSCCHALCGIFWEGARQHQSSLPVRGHACGRYPTARSVPHQQQQDAWEVKHLGCRAFQLAVS